MRFFFVCSVYRLILEPLEGFVFTLCEISVFRFKLFVNGLQCKQAWKSLSIKQQILNREGDTRMMLFS